MKRPLFFPLLGLILGIAFVRVDPNQLPAFALLTVLGALLLFLFFRLQQMTGLKVAYILLFMGVGYFSVFLEGKNIERHSNLWNQKIKINPSESRVRDEREGKVPSALGGMEGATRAPVMTGGEKNYWVGKVSEPCATGEEGEKLVLQMLEIKFPDHVIPLSGHLLLNMGKGVCSFQVGDILQGYSAFKKPKRFFNPGSFDYSFFLFRRGITATSFVESEEFVVKIGEEKTRLERFLQPLRSKAHAALQMIPETDLRQILEALLLGNQKSLSKNVRELFRKTGTTHLLVVSGLHFVMVGALFYGFFRLLFSLWPSLFLHLHVRKWALVAALFPLLIYACLVGGTPSVLRAFLTLLFIAVLFLFSRSYDALGLLFLIGFLLLLFFPFLLFELSFQLSFLSVFFILLWVPHWENFLLTRHEKLFSSWSSRKILQILLASLAVQIGLFPVLVSSFHQFSLVSLPANLLLIPLFTWVVLPLGFVGMVLTGLHSGFSSFFLMGAAKTVSFALFYLKFLTALPHGIPYVAGFNGVQIFAFYALVLFLLTPHSLLLTSRKWKQVLIGVLLFFNIVVWAYPSLRDKWEDSLRLSLIDVGQGDAMLLELPHGKKILVDGGGLAVGLAHSSFDIGEKVLLPFLFSKNIRALDIIVLTHPHPDHFAGLTFLLPVFHPQEIWWNGEKSAAPAFQDFLKEVSRLNIPLKRFDTSIPPFEIEGVSFEVLYPPPGPFAEKNPDSSTVNNHSLVLQLAYRGASILLTGDIEKETEAELVAGQKLKPVLVLKVPHHGSRSSSTPDFLNRVCPRVALMGVGRENRFGFPHPEVLERYQSMQSKIFRTDKDGEVELRWDGHQIRVSGFPNSPSLELANPEGLCK